MKSFAFDVCALGNALVDTEYQIDDRFLRDQGLEKGHMTLIDANRLRDLMHALQERPHQRASGGSAANTAIAIQGLGGKAHYACRVAGDEAGAHFLKGLHQAGIATREHRELEGITGRCLVMITPDAERTMTTFLGISEQLCSDDLDEKALRNTRFLYMEGYLASSATGRQAAVTARELISPTDTRSAITLSDASMVTFCRDGLTEMMGNGVDLLFANEEEALLWCKSDRIDVAAKELRDIAPQGCITLGARGALVWDGRISHQVATEPVKPLDTNGAGDTFAGATLWCLSQKMELREAARFANAAAALLVTRYGPRLDLASYATLKSRHFAH